jgi:membrane protein required for colicin V production
MILDIVVLILTVLAFIRGWKKGLLWGIGSLLAVFVGVLISLKLSHYVANFFFEKNILTSQYTVLISFVLLFVLTIFCFRQLAKLMEKILDKLFLGWVNHALGGMLYAFFVVFVTSLCIWLINKTALINQTLKKDSKIYSFIEPIAPKTIEVASAYLPLCKDLFGQITTTVDRAVEKIK